MYLQCGGRIKTGKGEEQVLYSLIFFILSGAAYLAWTAAKQKKKALRSVAESALCGTGALAAVNLFSAYTGVSIALNFASAFFAVVYGVPGIIMLLLARLLFDAG